LDRQGNLYYSDEFNHMVVCLGADGKVRWSRGPQNADSAACFHYPRGMALGRVGHQGVVHTCLAVADSWNRKVRFLTPEGEDLCSWNKACDETFEEVSDVRFIEGGGACSPEPSPGIWLVLDKGRHRLCAFTIDGQLIFQLGRAFAPSLAYRWTMDGLLQADPWKQGGTIETFPALDYLFYPERIIGWSPKALFLWEPLRRKLKLVQRGNLIPFVIPDTEDVQWISADQSGLLGRNEKTNRIMSFNASARICQEWEIEGIPIPGIASTRRCWVQHDDKLQLLTLGEEHIEKESASQFGFSVLLMTAQNACGCFERKAEGADIKELRQSLDDLQSLIDEVTKMDIAGSPPAEGLHSFISRLSDFKECRRAASLPMNELFHPLSLGFLASRLAGAAPGAGLPNDTFGKVQAAGLKLLDAAIQAYPKLLARMNALERFRQCLLDKPAQESVTFKPILDLADALHYEAFRFARWIYRWCAPQRKPGDLLDVAPTENPISALRYPSPAVASPAPSILREVDSISLEFEDDALPVKPWGLSAGADASLYVSILGEHRVRVLAPDAATPIADIGKKGAGPGEFNSPLGVAVDPAGRLWVCDTFNHRLQIIENPGDTRSKKIITAVVPWPLNRPAAVCVLADGTVWIAEARENRVTRLLPSGASMEICCDEGKEPGPLEVPIFLCPDASHARQTVWVVDKRNHRVLQFDAGGAYMRVIGSGDLRPGNLFYPVSLAVLSSGTIVVAQDPPDPCLVFFDQDGRESGRMYLDYCPSAMLFHRGRLLVNQLDGSCIRVYDPS
jgi:sugar lactone lactonase YvrE